MLNAAYERKWLIAVALFIFCYSGFLLIFRQQLTAVEASAGFIFKPETPQILLAALVTLLLHFALLGLSQFSWMGKWQKGLAVAVMFLFFTSLLYGFYIWYRGIMSNPFLFSAASLPWYAEERTKFLLVNTPLIFFFTLLVAERFRSILKH